MMALPARTLKVDALEPVLASGMGNVWTLKKRKNFDFQTLNLQNYLKFGSLPHWTSLRWSRFPSTINRSKRAVAARLKSLAPIGILYWAIKTFQPDRTGVCQHLRAGKRQAEFHSQRPVTNVINAQWLDRTGHGSELMWRIEAEWMVVIAFGRMGAE